ncbi:MAG: phosphoribosylaminoimidazolesuccinocarboxamide synthase [Lentisphaeria bacterium]
MLYDANGALMQTVVPGAPTPVRGKVRDIYDLGDSLIFIATDRISAFDCILPNGIPAKGKILTSISKFWFDKFSWMPNHIISCNPAEFPAPFNQFVDDLKGRAMHVRKATMLPVECIARGYLVGSGWKDYQATGEVCGLKLREGYQQAEKLDKALYTPSSKAEIGDHDENISFEKSVQLVGQEIAEKLQELTLKIYNEGADYARERGIILADTKFEFGQIDGQIVLADEVLTPDSSRFWPADAYAVGSNPPSLDKQYVRDYLESLDWDKTNPAPALTNDVIERTVEIYLDAYERLTGKPLEQ